MVQAGDKLCRKMDMSLNRVALKRERQKREQHNAQPPMGPGLP
jgi:hypothetical protein